MRRGVGRSGRQPRRQAFRPCHLGFIASFILLLPAAPVFAQQSRKLEPILVELLRPETRARVLRDAVVDRLASPGTLPLGGVLALRRASPLAEPVLGVFVRIQGPGGLAAIRQAGGEVGSVVGDYVTARVPVSMLEALAASPDIASIEAARALRMENDSSARTIGVDQLRTLVDGRWQGATGEGAIIGIYDTGIDLRHEDFIDPDGQTRLLGLWDQTALGTPPAGFTTGTYCSQESVQQHIESGGSSGCRQIDFHGHGTHVAGSAAGDGSAGGPNPYQYQFAGVAPGAKLLVVNGGPGVFFEDLIIDGLIWLRQEGLRLGLPVVANLSLGGQFGAHDGSRLYERMIDAISGPGFIVVIAAGNSGVNQNTNPAVGGTLIHARGFPTGTQATEFQFEIPVYTPNADACNGNRVSISFWYEATDSLLIEVVRPDKSSAGQLRGQAILDENAAGRVLIDNGSAGPNAENGDVEAAITLNGCGSSGVPAAGTWGIRVTPARPGSGQPYDMWIWNSVGAQPQGAAGFDNRLIVGSPGNSRRSVTVGAFVTKLCWPSIAATNSICYTQREELGDLARFSGAGPTRDGRVKPEIVAPGIGVVSAQSANASITSQRIAPDNVHATREGTSMATPQVTGAIAVLLSRNPTLTPEDVKAVIAGSATVDVFTSRVYGVANGGQASDWWGYGKLNVPGALIALADGGPATLTLVTEPAAPLTAALGSKGVLLPLLRLNFVAQGFESIDVTAVGFDVTGNDPGARLVLLRDRGDGVLDPTDLVVGGTAAPLSAAVRRVIIAPDTIASLRVPPFSPASFFLAVELSGRAPNGTVFEATLVPQELHSVGASSGVVDRIEGGIAAIGSGIASTTLLRADELLSFSENPVRHAIVVFNFARSPTTAAVYTITGRRVVDLCGDPALNCGAGADATFAEWDLRNDEGEQVAPGVYLLIFNVDGKVFREKLMIITPGAGPELQE